MPFKRFAALLLAVLMCLRLYACGAGGAPTITANAIWRIERIS